MPCTITPPIRHRVTIIREGDESVSDFAMLDSARRFLVGAMLSDADFAATYHADEDFAEMVTLAADDLNLSTAFELHAAGRGFDRLYTLATIPPASVELEPGCYIDGHLGQYAGIESVRLADEYAGTLLLSQWPTSADGSPMGTYADGGPWCGIAGTDEQMDTVELMASLMDEAESALNDCTTDGVWGWEDGEFFLRFTGNPYAAGYSAVPDYGGYNPFAVMADGGTLCESCVLDSSNPVADGTDGADVDYWQSDDGWTVRAWSHDGECDSRETCDHCGRVIIVGPECDEPGCTPDLWG